MNTVSQIFPRTGRNGVRDGANWMFQQLTDKTKKKQQLVFYEAVDAHVRGCLKIFESVEKSKSMENLKSIKMKFTLGLKESLVIFTSVYDKKVADFSE